MNRWKTVSAVLALFYFSPAVATTVYHWVDTNGNTVLSDLPPETGHYEQRHYADSSPQAPHSSTQIPHLVESEVTTRSQPILAPELKNPPPSQVSLINPSHEQTIRNNSGELMVSASTDTPLRPSYTLQLYINGSPFGPVSEHPQWLIENVDRGAHEVNVKLLKSGKVIASSSSVSLFMHRASKGQLPGLPKVGQPPAEAL